MSESSKVYKLMLILIICVFIVIVFFLSPKMPRTVFIEFEIASSAFSAFISMISLGFSKILGRDVFPKEKNYDAIMDRISWANSSIKIQLFILSYWAFLLSFGIFLGIAAAAMVLLKAGYS